MGFEIKDGVLTRYLKQRGLKEIIIPDGVTKIGEKAFRNCDRLVSITIPDGVTSIERQAFKNCKRLVSIIIADSVKNIEEEAFEKCESLRTITIPGSVTSIGAFAFRKCESLRTVTIPDGVTSIGYGAFEKCENLTEILVDDANAEYSSVDGMMLNKEKTKIILCPEGKQGDVVIPEGVTSVEDCVFYDCKSLTSITIPDSVTSIGDFAFNRCKSLRTVTIPGSVTSIGAFAFCECESLRAVTIPEGVTSIEVSAFLRCKNLTSVTLPDSVTNIEINAFANTNQAAVNIPKNYFQGKKELPVKPTMQLLESVWKTKATVKDYAAIYLFQPEKELVAKGKLPVLPTKQDFLTYAKRILSTQPTKGAQAMIELLRTTCSDAVCRRAVDFVADTCPNIAKDTLDEFVSVLRASPWKDADEVLKARGLLRSGSEAANFPEKTLVHPLEMYCRENFISSFIDETVKQTKRSDAPLQKVRYKGSKEYAPVFVVKCAIAPYINWANIDLTHRWETRKLHLDSDFFEAKFYPEADRVAAELDRESLMTALEEMAETDQGDVADNALLFPLCRYGAGKHIDAVKKAMRGWNAAKNEKAAFAARYAIMLSDSKEAILLADKENILSYYAKMRGMDAQEMCDSVLVDFGLDETGKKELNLGNAVVTVALNQDLSISVMERDTRKVLKSIPKRGADPEKYFAASTAYSDLKKNLKKVIKDRNERLFSEFLNGEEHQTADWKKLYLSNPVLRAAAQLIVWRQEENTFILAGSDPVDSAGAPYTIAENLPVWIAHPMEMQPEEVTRWQKYLTAHGLKQPFAQMWEPVIDVASIKPDRYDGCMIPLYRFMQREKHGIFMPKPPFCAIPHVSFDGCKVEVERMDRHTHEVRVTDRFSIKSFSCGEKLTKVSNHIVAYLDRITVYERVLKDDVTISTALPGFTLAQITEFINLAQTNNCTAVTALLMDYKNHTFPDHDPMDEFTLE